MCNGTQLQQLPAPEWKGAEACIMASRKSRRASISKDGLPAFQRMPVISESARPTSRQHAAAQAAPRLQPIPVQAQPVNPQHASMCPMGPKHRVVKKPVEKRPPSKQQQRAAKENAPAGGKVYTSKEVKTTTVVKNGMLTKTVTTITTGPDGQKHTTIEEHTEMVKGLRQHNRKPLEPLPIHGVEDAPSGNWGRPTSSHGTPSPPQAPQGGKQRKPSAPRKRPAPVRVPKEAPQETSRVEKLAANKEKLAARHEVREARGAAPLLGWSPKKIEECLARHNELRARHGAPPLKWRDDLARDAQKAANACVEKGHLFHSNHPNAGQNAAWNYPTFECAINGWYDEVHSPGYDFNNGGFTGGTGHFTQVVWNSCTHVGMAHDTNGDGTFMVANYYPPGNYMGRFDDEVKPLTEAGKKAEDEERKNK